MGYWLNSSDGIRCATCGREVHTSKCYGKKGFIRVELNLAERAVNDYYERTDIPSCTIEFCSLPCLQKADWKKLYADFIEFEDTRMVHGYYAKHGTACGGIEKTLVEQDPLDIPAPFFEPRPEPVVEPTPEPKVEPVKELAQVPATVINETTKEVIAEIKSERAVRPQCGMCQCEWIEGHEKTEKHKRLEANFSKKMRDFRLGGGALNNTIADIFVKESKSEEKVEEYKDTLMFSDLDQAYCVIENFDFGTIERPTFKKAVNYILKYCKDNFGTDDYRYRELFALIHKDGWEGTFDVRALCHAISLGCPHTEQKDCERSRTPLEEHGEQACERDKENLPDYKRGKCSHCRHLEGIKEKWEKKC